MLLACINIWCWLHGRQHHIVGSSIFLSVSWSLVRWRAWPSQMLLPPYQRVGGQGNWSAFLLAGLYFLWCIPMLSKSLTEPLASFSNVDPFRAFFAGQFIYNIGSLAINVSRYVPFLTCFLTFVVGCFLSRAKVRMHAGDTQDVSGALAVSRTETGRSSF